jgi:integrase
VSCSHDQSERVRPDAGCADSPVRAEERDSSAKSLPRQLLDQMAEAAPQPEPCLAESSPEIARTPERDSMPPATPNRKGRSMNRRYGQSGYVVKKGNTWHGRYYVDLPDRRKRVSVPIGPVDQFTKSQAKRKLRELLEQSGVNTEAHLLRAMTVSRTFEQEAAWWRQNKLSLFKPSCQETMGSHINKYLLPRFGQLAIEAVDERRAQEFVADLNRTELAPKSIRNIIGVLKLILGKKRWQDWSLILPEIPEKEQRYFTEDEMLKIIDATTGQWRALFATMAGTGLRCGEAFGLHVEDLDLATGRIHVRRSVWRGQEVSVKTKSGNRTVNIEPVLTEILRQHLNGRTSGRVFQTRNGTPLSKDNVRRKLVSVLDKLGVKRGGLHAFRHGRVSVLQENSVPGDLVKEWIGHSSLRTTSRYTLLRPDFRERVAAGVGLFKTKLDPIGPNSEETNAA